MNICIFEGYLTRDPELRTVTGKDGPVSVVSINLKVPSNRGNRFSFPKCEAWSKGAEVIADRYRKDDAIKVVCEHITDSWPDKENPEKKKYADKFRINEFGNVLGSLDSTVEANPVSAPAPAPEPEPAAAPTPPRRATPTRRRTPEPVATEADEEIPF